jgi:hypothetical protein
LVTAELLRVINFLMHSSQFSLYFCFSLDSLRLFSHDTAALNLDWADLLETDAPSEPRVNGERMVMIIRHRIVF